MNPSVAGGIDDVGRGAGRRGYDRGVTAGHIAATDPADELEGGPRVRSQVNHKELRIEVLGQLEAVLVGLDAMDLAIAELAHGVPQHSGAAGA